VNCPDAGSTLDLLGRRVYLDEDALRHIVEAHPEMDGYLDQILPTVESPDARDFDPRAGHERSYLHGVPCAKRERFYRLGLGPSRWLFVVVDFSLPTARVVTAYGSRKAPRHYRRIFG
jgi:hypothetical protein